GLVTIQNAPVEWRRVDHAGWHAEFPTQPHDASATRWTGGARDSMWQAVVNGTERFTLTVLDGDDAGNWMDRGRDRLESLSDVKLAAERPIEVAGRAGREFEFTAANRVMRARMVASGSRRFEITVSAPAWGENQRHFLDSFGIADTAA